MEEAAPALAYPVFSQYCKKLVDSVRKSDLESPPETFSLSELLENVALQQEGLGNDLIAWCETAEGEEYLKNKPFAISSLIEDLEKSIKMRNFDSRKCLKTIFKRGLFCADLKEQIFVYKPPDPFSVRPSKLLSEASKAKTSKHFAELFQSWKQTANVREQTNKITSAFVEQLHSAKLSNLGLEELRLAVFGSCCNSFAMNTSDIDATLLTESFFPERTLLNFIHEKLGALGPSHFRFEISDRKDLRFPLLKVKYEKNEIKNTIDLSVNNVLGVINSELLSAYARVDERCQHMGVLLKEWGRIQRVINKNALSSYAMILLMIYFLQIKKILPSLQRVAKETQSPETLEWIEVRRVERYDQVMKFRTRATFEADPAKVKAYMRERNYPENSQNVYELLTEFFEFYSADGIFRRYRLRCNIKRGDVDFINMNNPNENNLLFSIKDPFDKCHNPGAKVCKNNTEFKSPRDILSNFTSSAYSLKQNKIKEVFPDVK